MINISLLIKNLLHTSVYSKRCVQRFLIGIVLVGFNSAIVYAQQPLIEVNQSSVDLVQATFSIVSIDLKEYMELEIGNSNDGEVHILEFQQGEYKDAVSIKSNVRQDSLIIEDFQNFTFEFPQDKLSAHKVIDARMRLLVPRGKKLFINTGTAVLKISGDYASLYINQFAGQCVLTKLTGDFQLTSIYADVIFKASHYLIDSATQRKVLQRTIPKDYYKYTAQIETIHGSISVQ